jgi:hypothetical protein
MTCRAPLTGEELAAYWLGELDEAVQSRADEHLLGCAACSERLAALVALGRAIRAVFAQGMVRAFVTEPFVRRLVEQGARLREYRVPANGSVECTVTPEDQFVVAQLQAPLEGVTRVDAVSFVPGAEPQIARDVPFDAERGEVIAMPDLQVLRRLASHQQRVRLLAVDEGGERLLGEYTFNHTAHAGDAGG